MEHISHFKEQLQCLITAFKYDHPITPMVADKWVAVSALQKAIRRGNVKIAFNACARLITLDKRMLYRRLAITVLEDIGLAAPQLVKLTLVGLLEGRSVRQMDIDPTQLIFPLIQALCEAPKERSGDYLIMMCEYHTPLNHERDDFFYYSNSDLVDVIGNDTYSLHKRALATWYLAGTRRYLSDNLATTQGDMDALFWIFEEMGAQKCLLEIIRSAAKKINNPLPVHYLLKYLTLGDDKTSPIEAHKLPDTSTYQEIPLYALGGHTRLGKKAIRELLKATSPLTRYMDNNVIRKYRRTVYESALFDVESELVDREYMFPGYDAMKSAANTAILLANGVNENHIDDLLHLTQESLPELNEIRERLLKETRNNIEQLRLSGL